MSYITTAKLLSMTIGSLAAGLLFVLPGFVANELYRAAFPAKKDSDFARVVWSVVYSLIILAVAQLIDRKLNVSLLADEKWVPHQ
ncbi:MAG: hypothetical protein R3C68_09905 [Myxococcota bacterium]